MTPEQKLEEIRKIVESWASIDPIVFGSPFFQDAPSTRVRATASTRQSDGIVILSILNKTKEWS